MAPNITKEELWKKLQRGDDFLLVDVLDAASYGRSHLPGAINAPLAQLDEAASDWPKDTEIVVYCGSYT